MNGILELKDQVWGYCYTQLTDVEQEQNGIYYYDRTPKFDTKLIHSIFSKNPEDLEGTYTNRYAIMVRIPGLSGTMVHTITCIQWSTALCCGRRRM